MTTGVEIVITDAVLLPEKIIGLVKNKTAGCVLTYVGLIRDTSAGKPVVSVNYEDTGNALKRLTGIARNAKKRYAATSIAIAHREGKLYPGDINLVIAVAAGHREEGFSACRFIIDAFKEQLPTRKEEIYADGSKQVWEY